MISWSIKKTVILLAVLVLGPLSFQSSQQPLESSSMATALTFGAELVAIVAVAVVIMVSMQIGISKLPREALSATQWNRSPFDKSRPLDLYEFSGYGMLVLGAGYVVSQLKHGIDANCIVPLFAGVGLLLGVRLARLLLGAKNEKAS
jgi:hypothetical protein